MDRKAALAKFASLAAQCPVVETPPNAASLPIHFDRVGEGERVVIIHGGVQGAMGGGPATFSKQKVLAERGYGLEIADRPGFGRSPSRGVDDMEDSAVWIAEALGDGAHLIGHSWGGAAALAAAGRRPEAVRSLILVEAALQTLALTDPQVQANPVEADKIFAMVDSFLAAETPVDYARLAIRGVGRTVGEVGSSQGELDEDTLRRWGCAALQNKMSPPPTLRQAATTVRDAGIPVLVISGSWSETIQAVGDVIARATGGKHVRMSSPNHYPQYENPEEFNNLIDEFMRNGAG